jgi:uncharacterized C2H2 Zn-finger protein
MRNYDNCLSGVTVSHLGVNRASVEASYRKQTLMKTQWRCPNCDMSSSRHWNVRRHVERSHDSNGQPVSDQHMKQNLTKMNPKL